MALKAKHKEIEFGVGDVIRVVQKIKDDNKSRTQAFEGTVLGIKGRGETKTFTVRRIGAQNIGIERIFPLNMPSIEEIEVVKEGVRGVRRAKLYYTRDKSKKEIESIYSRTKQRGEKLEKTKKTPKKKRKSSKKK